MSNETLDTTTNVVPEVATQNKNTYMANVP